MCVWRDQDQGSYQKKRGDLVTVPLEGGQAGAVGGMCPWGKSDRCCFSFALAVSLPVGEMVQCRRCSWQPHHQATQECALASSLL